jgi:hypothetical protein
MGWVVSVTLRPRFSPGERTPGTHCTGGWVGPRAGLDTEARAKILCPCRGSNPGRLFYSQAPYRLRYPSPLRYAYSFKQIYLIFKILRTEPALQLNVMSVYFWHRIWHALGATEAILALVTQDLRSPVQIHCLDKQAITSLVFVKLKISVLH